MVTQKERLDLFDKIKEILKGIDQTESETEHGWWSTSTGAEFGWRKMEELKEVILSD